MQACLYNNSLIHRQIKYDVIPEYLSEIVMKYFDIFYVSLYFKKLTEQQLITETEKKNTQDMYVFCRYEFIRTYRFLRVFFLFFIN